MSGPPAHGPPGNGTMTPAAIDAIYWKALGGNPSDYLFYKSIGLALSSIFVCSIWTHIVKYYEWFHKDQILMKLAVGAGCALATAGLVVDLVHERYLAYHVMTDFISIQHLDGILTMVTNLFARIATLAANSYYSYKVYKLSGQRWYIGAFLALWTLGEFGFVFYVAIWSFRYPQFSLQNPQPLISFGKTFGYYMYITGSMSLAHDAFLCVTLLVLLYTTNGRLFHLQNGLLRRLVLIIFECMVPPMIVTVLIKISDVEDSKVYGWKTIMFGVSCPLYLHAVLVSLCSRRSIREFLDNTLASNGVERLQPLSRASKTAESVNVTVDQVSTVHKVDEYPRVVRINRDPSPEPSDKMDMDKEWDVESGKSGSTAFHNHVEIYEAYESSTALRASRSNVSVVPHAV